MTDANNNSGNNCAGGTVVVTGAGGGGGGGSGILGNGQWITVQPGKQFTITVPSGSGTCSTGGQLILQSGTGTGISFDDIDLAVPVNEKEEISDGCFCKKCKEYYQYAEPNQDDGTLICYGCRVRW